mgnify:CR=1 FL=1
MGPARPLQAGGSLRRAGGGLAASGVTEKSAYDLVTSFDEYAQLKALETQQYHQRKKSVVTAASVMRHVRWKLGKLSDREFYAEECKEL